MMTNSTNATRANHEVAHGKMLAEGNPEALWGWGTPAGQRRARRRADLIARGAKLAPGLRVLEIGCGTGMFTEMFAQTGARVDALDISPELIELAKRRLPANQVCFRVGRFEEENRERKYDAVIGSSVLHHLDLPDALAQAYRLLKPGGLFAFAEPNLLNPQIFLERTLRFLPFYSYVSPDETAFVRWRLRACLEANGFVDVAVSPFDWLHPRTPKPLIGLVGAAGWLLERCPGLREFSGSLWIRGRRPGPSALEKTPIQAAA